MPLCNKRKLPEGILALGQGEDAPFMAERGVP